VIAFKSAPSFDFANLYQRATTIRVTTKLPAHAWVNDIKTVLEGG
jgi:spermidine synthase